MSHNLKQSLIYSIITFIVTMILFMAGDYISALNSGESFGYSGIWHLSFPTYCALLDFMIIYFSYGKDKAERESMGVMPD